MLPEVYIGDGVYASFDGWHVVLRAPRDDDDQSVYLEPLVVAAFQRYLADLGTETHVPPA